VSKVANSEVSYVNPMGVEDDEKRSTRRPPQGERDMYSAQTVVTSQSSYEVRALIEAARRGEARPVTTPPPAAGGRVSQPPPSTTKPLLPTPAVPMDVAMVKAALTADGEPRPAPETASPSAAEIASTDAPERGAETHSAPAGEDAEVPGIASETPAEPDARPATVVEPRPSSTMAYALVAFVTFAVFVACVAAVLTTCQQP
jgi:hypothetical protein